MTTPTLAFDPHAFEAAANLLYALLRTTNREITLEYRQELLNALDERIDDLMEADREFYQ